MAIRPHVQVPGPDSYSGWYFFFEWT